MNEQSFGDPIYPTDNVNKNDQDVNSPVVNPDLFVNPSSENTALIQQTPMSGSAAVVVPMDETIVHETPMAAAVTVAHPAPTGANPGSPVSLLTREESEQLRTRWMEIQGKFVDEPRPAVQEADELVSEVVKKIIQMFASEHNSLEGQWNRGVDVSTEDLRQALQHYRSFFNRLVV
jgi:hypothetical protein